VAKDMNYTFIFIRVRKQGMQMINSQGAPHPEVCAGHFGVIYFALPTKTTLLWKLQDIDFK
jgi:hypothetical protein